MKTNRMTGHENETTLTLTGGRVVICRRDANGEWHADGIATRGYRSIRDLRAKLDGKQHRTSSPSNAR